jgi:hypothetical protein
MSNRPDGRRQIAASLFRRAAPVAVIGGAVIMFVTVDVPVCRAAPPRKESVSTASRHNVRVLSVKLQRDDREGTEILLKVSVRGRTPVSFTQSEVELYLIWPGATRVFFGKDVRFPKKTPEIITVVPDKPQVMTLKVLGGFGPPEEWNELKPGTYTLLLWIRGNTKYLPSVDNHWTGLTWATRSTIVRKFREPDRTSKSMRGPSTE